MEQHPWMPPAEGRPAVAPAPLETERAQAAQRARRGQYGGALAILERALASVRAHPQRRFSPLRRRELDLRVARASCWTHLGHCSRAQAEALEVLETRGITPATAFRASLVYAIAAVGCGAPGLALIALEGNPPGGAEALALAAHGLCVRAAALDAAGRPLAARELYLRAARVYEALGEPFEACKARLNAAAASLARGEEAAAREHLEAAAHVAERAGYTRLEAVAWALRAQLVKGGRAAAYLERSTELARLCGYEPLARWNGRMARALTRVRLAGRLRGDTLGPFPIREWPDPW